MSRKMSKKQLVSSARQHTFISLIVVKKYLAKHNVMALEDLPHLMNLSSPDFVLFP
jgi:hypothetical protein